MLHPELLLFLSTPAFLSVHLAMCLQYIWPHCKSSCHETQSQWATSFAAQAGMEQQLLTLVSGLLLLLLLHKKIVWISKELPYFSQTARHTHTHRCAAVHVCVLHTAINASCLWQKSFMPSPSTSLGGAYLPFISWGFARPAAGQRLSFVPY